MLTTWVTMTQATTNKRTSERGERKPMADTFDTKHGNAPGRWRIVLWVVLTLGCFLAAANAAGHGGTARRRAGIERR